MSSQAQARVDARFGSVRLWFAADAVVTAATALLYLSAAGTVASVLGGTTEAFRAIGAFLLLFAACVAVVARPDQPHAIPVRAVIAVNAVWVAASLAVAAGAVLELNGIGRTWAVMQAAAVGLLAVLQQRASGSSV